MRQWSLSTGLVRALRLRRLYYLKDVCGLRVTLVGGFIHDSSRGEACWVLLSSLGSFSYLADLVWALLLEVDVPHDTPYNDQILMCRRKGMTNVSGLFTHSALIVCAISGDSE